MDYAKMYKDMADNDRLSIMYIEDGSYVHAVKLLNENIKKWEKIKRKLGVKE